MGIDTIMRERNARLFAEKVGPKIASSRAFTVEEKEAAEYVTGFMKKFAGSIKAGGRKRNKEVTEVSLYTRKYRAERALAAAQEADGGVTDYKMRQLRAEAKKAAAEYEKFRAKAAKGR